MANEQNLRPVRTESEARERGRNGGIKSGQARKAKKTMAAVTKTILDSKITDPKMLDVIKKSGIEIKGKPTFRDFMTASIIMRDIKKGDVRTLLAYAELLGENVKDENQENGYLADLIDGLKEE